MRPRSFFWQTFHCFCCGAWAPADGVPPKKLIWQSPNLPLNPAPVCVMVMALTPSQVQLSSIFSSMLHQFGCGWPSPEFRNFQKTHQGGWVVLPETSSLPLKMKGIVFQPSSFKARTCQFGGGGQVCNRRFLGSNLPSHKLRHLICKCVALNSCRSSHNKALANSGMPPLLKNP